MKKKTKKYNCNKIAAVLYMIAGVLFISGGARFYYRADSIGAVIYAVTGIFFFIAAIGFYCYKDRVKR